MAAKTTGAVQVLKDKDDTVKRTPMARPSNGREGKPIRLLSNHFAVKLRGVDAVFYQYSVMNNFEILHLALTSSIYSEITFGYNVGLHQICIWSLPHLFILYYFWLHCRSASNLRMIRWLMARVLAERS
jgi:hypothetical protein